MSPPVMVICHRGHDHPRGEHCKRCKADRRAGERLRARLARQQGPPPTHEGQGGRVEQLDPVSELERMKKKTNLTPEEWAAVQTATEQIRAYLHSKATNAGERFDGRPAWDVIEEATTDHRRFQQLASMATVLHKATDAERAKGMKTHGSRYSPETVAKVRALRKNDYSHTTIAAKLGISHSTVSKILTGRSHRESTA